MMHNNDRPLRLEAAICLSRMCATDMDAVAVLRGYAMQVALTKQSKAEQVMAITALLSANICGIADLELLPYCVQIVWTPGDSAQRVHVAELMARVIRKNAANNDLVRGLTASAERAAIPVAVRPGWVGNASDSNPHERHSKGLGGGGVAGDGGRWSMEI